jgi:DNA-binding response OmpR family regulator
MILLVACPGSLTANLASMLNRQRLPAKACGTFDEGLQAALKSPPPDLILVGYPISGTPPVMFIRQLARRGNSAPIIVMGAPMAAEAELFRAGALWNFGPGYSPGSAALMCRSLVAYARRLSARRAGIPRSQHQEFRFGDGEVSVSRRELKRSPMGRPRHRIRPGRQGARPEPVRLTDLQVRLLRALNWAPGRVLDYEFISHEVWRRPFRGRNEAIRELVSCLRRRFESAGMDFGRWVETVRGQGYRYDPATVSRTRSQL